MLIKSSAILRNFVGSSNLWQKNRLILREFKNFRGVAIIAIVCSLIAAITSGSTIALIGTLLKGLTNTEQPALQTGIEWIDIFILGNQASSSERIARLSGIVILFIWLQAVFMYLGELYSKLAAINLTECLRKSLFEQLQSVSLSFFSKTKPGELLNSVRAETNQLQQAFIVVALLITQGSTLLVYLVLMLLLSWQLTIAAFLVFGLLSLGVSTITAKVREASFDVPTANGKFSSLTLELDRKSVV